MPLEGLRVIDLTRALSGPFCSMILADLGADIVKIEPLPDGEMSRAWGPFDHGVSTYFLSTNRNKRGIAVDFESRRGSRSFTNWRAALTCWLRISSRARWKRWGLATGRCARRTRA